ncbi:LysR substrate-binding domain-containing protein [Moritella sp. Urea-trap-13]|uniref:LysR substrate-binding domain-containing protein n=1 Tax=Moritella sp. Urea-trap-13 TaxID=2058327 RepID=UPI000C33A984|nr:LysR substrate-binding domain-containing protein [Moritella sp. Urea-trap-13]PKH07586.1 LysR family transcriptional regulator [Moritella sp. Urea-trap-13]
MNLDNLARIDLNLLVILQILLEEESVTRAANRLHLSQSALSKSLTRLRDTLDDPLFLRTAHGLKPTAHALQLKAQLPTILQGLYQISLPPSFEPAKSHRQFSFAMLESAYETLLPYYIGPILSQAPKLNLEIYGWNEKSLLDLQQGQIDFGITARELHPTADFRLNNLPDGIAHQRLFTDNQVCLVRSDHPMLASINAGQWDVETYLSMSHVQVRCEGNDWWLLDYQLAESGQHRHICATLPDFYGAASVCAHSDLVLTLPSCFVSHAQKLYDLVQLPLPIDFSSLVYVLLWHERNNDEPGHKWVRDIICQSVERAID